MKKIVILLISIVFLIYLYNTTTKKEVLIPNEAIRFRVIANSNTIYDQDIKIQLKNVVQNKILELTSNSKTIDETRKVLKDNIKDIDTLVKNTLNKLGYDKKYNINYGYNYFPKKVYKGITYKEGEYESLVISLGEGNGDNWWCVLFPPLCMVESNENDVSNAEYTFFIKEILEKYVSAK